MEDSRGRTEIVGNKSKSRPTRKWGLRKTDRNEFGNIKRVSRLKRKRNNKIRVTNAHSTFAIQR